MPYRGVAGITKQSTDLAGAVVMVYVQMLVLLRANTADSTAVVLELSPLVKFFFGDIVCSK